jgi:hypothetical protein
LLLPAELERGFLVQVIHLEEGDVEGEDAAAFFSALGVSDPTAVSIKPAA